jgi:hypothetical protein
MDSAGARLLVERIRAAATIGRVVQVERPAPDLELAAGDTGTIQLIRDEGWLVAWDKGSMLVVDPEIVSLRIVA